MSPRAHVFVRDAHGIRLVRREVVLFTKPTNMIRDAYTTRRFNQVEVRTCIPDYLVNVGEQVVKNGRVVGLLMFGRSAHNRQSVRASFLPLLSVMDGGNLDHVSP